MSVWTRLTQRACCSTRGLTRNVCLASIFVILQLSVSEKESGRKFEVELEPRFVTQLPSVTVGCCCKQNKWIRRVNGTRASSECSDLSSRLVQAALLHRSVLPVRGERNDSDAVVQGHSCRPGTQTLVFSDQKAVWFCWNTAEPEGCLSAPPPYSVDPGPLSYCRNRITVQLASWLFGQWCRFLVFAFSSCHL